MGCYCDRKHWTHIAVVIAELHLAMGSDKAEQAEQYAKKLLTQTT